MALSKSERIDLVEDARESLQQAIECLRQAFPGDRYVESYMIEQIWRFVQAATGSLAVT